MNARDYALVELDARRLPGWPPVLKHTRQTPPADPRDRALAEQIINGVIKNLLLLQHLIGHYANRRLLQIDPLVQKILAIALYQLRFLDRIPASAAVDEAVEQTRRFRRHKATGFTNAVLRNAVRQPGPPLPSAEDDPLRHAEIVLSHPPELFRRLLDLFGLEQALRVCLHDNREPPTIVRMFHGAAVERLQDEHVHVMPHEQSGMYVVEGAKQPLLAEWAQRGIAQVQDPTAALVVDFLDVQPGQTVLDRCAGLGTKTLQIHERVGPDGLIIAVDPNGPRCQGLRHMLTQRQIQNVTVHQADMMTRLQGLVPYEFDRILVDAPCSNSGVLPRRPEAKYAQTDKSLQSLRQLQLQIFEDTAPHLAPHGLLVYSTCSLWPQENEGVVEAFLARNSSLEKVQEKFTPPGVDEDNRQYRDGGYAVALRKR
jgi:16S rRNA (cytosine967-C5)-methyltransferase